jgi:hypothetical protein
VVGQRNALLIAHDFLRPGLVKIATEGSERFLMLLRR